MGLLQKLGDLKVGWKLGLLIVVFVIGQFAIGFIAVQGASDIKDMSSKTVQGNQIINKIQTADVELLDWFLQVNILLNDQEVSKFGGELNRDNTSLAKFLKSEERDIATKLNPETKQIFADIEAEHKKLFEAGNTLSGYFPDAKLDLGLIAKSLDIYKNGIDPGITALRKHLENVREKIRQTAVSEKGIEHQADSMFEWSAIVVVGTILICGFLGYMITNAIRGPMQIMSSALEKVAEGDLSAKVSLKYMDELGEMGTSLNRAITSMRTAVELIRSNAASLVDSSKVMSRLSQTMSSDAEQTNNQVKEVSNSSQLVEQNMNSVATAAREMNATIRDVEAHTVQASEEATQAVTMAQQAKETIGQLGISSNQISSVVSLINSVAEQTNLLALNATIEAARAGEAGKGFAVVATEVKELAKQTGAATHDISERIKDVQEGTVRTVQVIERLSATVATFSEVSLSIAGAIEEQGATTNEISRNVGEAADGTTIIAKGMADVANAAQRTSNGTKEILSTAEALGTMAVNLKEAVAHFTV